MKINKVKKSRKGLNIFYYGKGKGKTTAIMGLAARAAGAGMNVYILQFVKSNNKKGKKLQSGEWPTSSEILYFDSVRGLKGLGSIITEQTGAGFVGILGDKKQRAEHVQEAKKGLDLAKKAISSDNYDLIVLDELVSAAELHLISEEEIVSLISSKPAHLHLAYSGHDKFKNIIKASDLVSEIKMIKHPYYNGILAQRGIDF
ncbi:MAG: cob(I)yrinic acid a,c-diamide adenosyltransferase [Candidatus Doudnabacteria bacterium]